MDPEKIDDETQADNPVTDEAQATEQDPPAENTEPEDWDIDAVLSEEANPGDDADRADVADDAEKDEGEYEEGEEPAAAKDKPEEPQEQEAAKPDAEEEDLSRDLTEDQLAKFRPRSRERIKAMMRDRAQLREELNSYKPVAEKAQPFVEAMDKHQLTDENVQEVLHIGAVLRQGDFKKFTELMEPYMAAARRAMGDELPNDLHQMVENGDTTPEVARELARRRHENALAQKQLEQAQQSQATVRQQQEQAQQAATVRDALNAWEQQALTSNPDYEHIRAAVHEQVQLEIQANGTPASAEAAQQLAQRAHDRVKKLAARPAPKPATPPRPPVGGTNPGSAKAAPTQPETLDDVIENVLGG
jgi:hypothetical protein